MKNIIIAAIALSSSFAFAVPTVKTWVNPECASGSCEVKGMKLFTEKGVAARLAGNSMTAEIEGASKSDLKKYAFVQYIKGCVFETDSQGTIKMGTREFWGYRTRPFKHVGFELDSASDRDPLYWSNANAGFDDLRGIFIPRNSYYVYANPLLTEAYGSWAGKISNLKENKIFIQDAPTVSGWDINDETMKVTARNASLNFKVCLHKIEDVPATVESPATEIPGAIVCMSWDSNFIYNFSTRKFDDKKDQIHQACK